MKDPRTWHPEMAEPRDLKLAEQFAALVIGGGEIVDAPTPGSRLDRFMREWDTYEAGDITRAELDRRTRALSQEVIGEVEAEERRSDETGGEPTGCVSASPDLATSGLLVDRGDRARVQDLGSLLQPAT